MNLYIYNLMEIFESAYELKASLFLSRVLRRGAGRRAACAGHIRGSGAVSQFFARPCGGCSGF